MNLSPDDFFVWPQLFLHTFCRLKYFYYFCNYYKSNNYYLNNRHYNEKQRNKQSIHRFEEHSGRVILRPKRGDSAPNQAYRERKKRRSDVTTTPGENRFDTPPVLTGRDYQEILYFLRRHLSGLIRTGDVLDLRQVSMRAAEEQERETMGGCFQDH